MREKPSEALRGDHRAAGDGRSHASCGPKSAGTLRLLEHSENEQATKREEPGPPKCTSRKQNAGSSRRSQYRTDVLVPTASPNHLVVDARARQTVRAAETQQPTPVSGPKRNTPLHPTMPLLVLSDDGESDDESIEIMPPIPQHLKHRAAEEDEIWSAKDAHGNYRAQWTGFIDEAPAIQRKQC